MPARSPLMHATGMYTTLGALVASGRVVFLTGRSYDPAELARTVAPERVDTVSIVGDVFALPLADALDAAAAAGRPMTCPVCGAFSASGSPGARR